MATGSRSKRAGLDRIVEHLGEPDLVRKLVSDLTAADLTTLLLSVSQERAARLEGPDVLARYLSDRFSRPGGLPFERLREVEDRFIAAVPEAWEWVVPSPLVPFGAHAVLGPVSQDRVVSTIRANEVAADPTVALALEAAAARRESRIRRTAPPKRLATIQRIVRGQRYSSPLAFTHFLIFALVTAGRSHAEFDLAALQEHLDVYVAALLSVSSSIGIVVSVASPPSGSSLMEALGRRWAGTAGVAVTEDRRRLAEQRYYRRACFKVNAVMGSETVEIADGGFTDWTERLLQDRRERLLISGAGLDRPTLAIDGRLGSEGSH